MLTQIDISHFVTIPEVSLSFAEGTTAITGETGTGKSILMEAIALALGGRAAGHTVRPGAERADITLHFDLTHLPVAREWLHSMELPTTEPCLVRRTLTADGRSRSYVNGISVPLSRLRELGNHLIHLHGQHEQQTLFQPEARLALLDGFAGTRELTEKISVLSRAFRALNAEIIALQSEIAREQNQAEWLRFQLSELQALQLSANAFQSLDEEQRRLARAESTREETIRALACLNGEPGLLSLLPVLRQAIEKLYPAETSPWQETLRQILVQLNELEHTLQQAAGNALHSPEQLAAVESRLSVLFDVARRHKIPPEQLYDFQQQMEARLTEQHKGAEHLAELKAQAETLRQQYGIAADSLSEKRIAAAGQLEKDIHVLFQLLALPQAAFSIVHEPDISECPPNGREKPVFLIRTSPGQAMQPVGSIASGGELSRISLAIHIASARQHATPTLIFDEVDAGTGGSTAETIGKLLRDLGKNHQVFCITHTPQVAAQTHHHVRVQKNLVEGIACTCLEVLTPEKRVQEIARMLGGIEMTSKTLAHAREMAEKSGIGQTC